MCCFLIGNFLGNLENETDVLDWMLDQKTDESIEEIDRDTLFEYISSKDFLAVVFCKYSDAQSYKTLHPIFVLF